MKKLTIIYIATDKYIDLFDQFYKSVLQLRGDKNLILITNSDTDFVQNENCPIQKIYINHLPWPLITLLKFHYIYNVLDNCGEYVLYANSNFLFNRDFQIEEDDQLHFSYVDTKFYNSQYGFWPSMNEFDRSLKHVLGGFFYAKKELLKDVCESIISDINEKLMKRIIYPMHDETALNLYYSEHKDNVKLHEIHSVGMLSENFYKSGCTKSWLMGQFKL